MKSNQHLINLNLANCLFYLYYFILIGIAGLDNSTGEILTPFCLFIKVLPRSLRKQLYRLFIIFFNLIHKLFQRNTTFCPYWKQDKESQVVITIENFEANLGGRPYEKVQSVGLGFDWEAGQFRIEPENKLMEVSKRK